MMKQICLHFLWSTPTSSTWVGLLKISHIQVSTLLHPLHFIIKFVCLSVYLVLGIKHFYLEFHTNQSILIIATGPHALLYWNALPKSSSSVCLLKSSTSSSGLLTAIARYLSRTSRTMMKLERCLRSRRMKFNHQVNENCFRVKGASWQQNIIDLYL